MFFFRFCSAVYDVSAVEVSCWLILSKRLSRVFAGHLQAAPDGQGQTVLSAPDRQGQTALSAPPRHKYRTSLRVEQFSLWRNNPRTFLKLKEKNSN